MVVATGVIAFSGGAGATISSTLNATTTGRSAASSVVSPTSGVTSAPVVVAVRTFDANAQFADSALVLLGDAAMRHDLAQTRLRFVDARRAYKRVEWLAEHYTPVTAAALNGPAIDRPDEESPQIIVRPTGLQVMEAMLYRDAVPNSILDSVAIQARIARTNIKRIRERVGETLVTESQLFDAARTEIGRMVSLGVSGFDTPMAGTALPEASAVIQSLAEAMTQFAPASEANRKLQRIATGARAFLDSAKSFNAFDHFTFIAEYANPLSHALGELQRVANVPRLTDPRAWNASSNSVFDSDAFNAQGFAPPGARRTSPPLVALGARLFNETRLSGRNDRSCVTCHMPSRALSDGQRVPALLPASMVASGARVTANERRVAAPARNTPTLYNAALQAASFSDARITFLEDQITTVIHNPREMDGDIEHAASILRQDSSYAPLFHAAFGEVPDSAAMSRELRGALAAYLRSLVRLNSRFDRAMRGDAMAMTPGEKQGFNLFMGKARCATCHFAPLFNGTVPPGYAESEVEVIGVPKSFNNPTVIDPDLGAGMAERAPLHNHAFKTSTVRNAAVTAPYMHNGSMATLEELIDFYDAGGGAGLGLAVPNQTLASDSLHLSKLEKRQLIQFIGALTDSSSGAGYGMLPQKLPLSRR